MNAQDPFERGHKLLEQPPPAAQQARPPAEDETLTVTVHLPAAAPDAVRDRIWAALLELFKAKEAARPWAKCVWCAGSGMICTRCELPDTACKCTTKASAMCGSCLGGAGS